MKAHDERIQTRGEEVANSVSHGMALLAATAAVPILVVSCAQRGTALNVAATCVFAATMLLVYAASALYHAIPHEGPKRFFRKLDQGAIFLFIAGSYTPFALGPLEGPWGWTLFALVWSLAAVGVTLKALDRMSHPFLSTGLYLAMGWLVVIAAKPLLANVAMPGLILLAAGGLAYTVGVVFFALDSRLRYAHFVWHLFVVAGTACHFFAVLDYTV
ncbi:MAG: hemolysin III family protein [Casimicrobiaceae bacterium]